MQIPLHADMIMKELSAHGHQAYAVGGCVRDSLLGLIPHDWDICTSATPGQVCECLSGRWRISATGIRHGSVTASADGVPPIEITSFRADGSYSDSRHPDQVRFVKSLRVDLARRDFTMNALAYAPDAGLIDYFGGESDLRAGLIRAIGDPGTRFQEDALRIMRALRFAATYSFELETGTAAAARAHAGRLAVIAPERIKPEFFKLLAGAGAAAALSTCPSAITAFLPEILPLLPETGSGRQPGADERPSAPTAFTPEILPLLPETGSGRQPGADKRPGAPTKPQQQATWQHTLATIGAAPPDPLTRLAILLQGAEAAAVGGGSVPAHCGGTLGDGRVPDGDGARDKRKPDVGGAREKRKPDADGARDKRKPDADGAPIQDGCTLGEGRRPDIGRAAAALRRLGCTRQESETVCTLMRYGSTELKADARHIKRMLNRLGAPHLHMLINMLRADAAAHASSHAGGSHAAKLDALDTTARIVDRIITEKQCYRICDLAIGGNDLIAAGIPAGPAVGAALETLLDKVIDGDVENEREALLKAAITPV